MISASAFTVSLVRVTVLALGLAVVASPFSSTTQAGITSPYKAKSTFELSPGVEYSVGTMKTTGGRRQSVRVVTVDPSHPEVKLRALLSNDKAVQREKSSQTARRKSQVGMEAMAAINGGMARRNAVNAYAAPLSMHVSNGELMVAQACTWPTIGIDDDGDARIANVRVHMEVTIPGLRDPRTIHRLNTHRDDPKVVLFTRKFAKSTRTASGGTEVVLDLADKLRPYGTQEVRVVKVRRGGGNTDLLDGQAVISMKGPNNQWVKDLKVGQRLQLTTRVVRKVNKRCGGQIAEATDWSGVVEALGGNYYTARNGKVAAPSRSAYPAGSQRHPRTGVGVTSDGRVMMITVDGRQSGYSVGVTLGEMGRLMLSLGAKHAFNLDGGGSTAMSRRFTNSGEFKITNRPSDGKERSATNALAAFEIAP